MPTILEWEKARGCGGLSILAWCWALTALRAVSDASRERRMRVPRLWRSSCAAAQVPSPYGVGYVWRRPYGPGVRIYGWRGHFGGGSCACGRTASWHLWLKWARGLVDVRSCGGRGSGVGVGRGCRGPSLHSVQGQDDSKDRGVARKVGARFDYVGVRSENRSSPSSSVGLWRSWERASMAWKRSPVRSRSGPPIHHPTSS